MIYLRCISVYPSYFHGGFFMSEMYWRLWAVGKPHLAHGYLVLSSQCFFNEAGCARYSAGRIWYTAVVSVPCCASGKRWILNHRKEPTNRIT